jgi:ABC-2 type transport system permease protein
MFKHIIRYDWLLLRSTRIFALSVALLVLFTAFALWNGARHVTFQRTTLAAIDSTERAAYAALQSAVRDIEQGKPYKGNEFQNPQLPYPIGGNKGARFATLPPAPLAMLSFGQSDLLPYYYRVTMTKQQSLYHAEEIENASILYNGNFDVAFVVVYLLPLLIIALSYNVVSSEREQGTLSMLLTSDVRFGSLVLSKFLFRFVLVSLVFAVVLLAGLGLAGINLPQAAPELALLLSVTMLYAAFWFALSFLVNSFGRNSGVNAALLLGVWLLLVLIIPSILTIAATTLHPAPSRVELITQTREASDAAKKRTAQLLSKFYEDHPELLPKGKEINPKDFATASLTAQMDVDKSLKPLQERFHAQTEAQQSLISLYRFLSPAVFVQQTLNDIAGTGYRRYADFNAQTYSFYQRFQQFFVEKVFRQERMTSADFERIPAFHNVQTAPTLLIPSNVINMALLLVLTAACVSVGLTKTARMRFVEAFA